jgi:uncharacterized protein
MGKQRLQPSKYLELKEKNGITAIFHRLHPQPIYVETKEWIKVKDNLWGEEALVKELKKRNLIVQPSEDEKEIDSISRQYNQSSNEVTILYLILTHKCNLRCRYCFVSQSFGKREQEIMMNPEIAKRGIYLWQKHIEDNFNNNCKYSVIFYGGEPLLNIETFRRGLEYIASLQKKGKLPESNLEILLNTNGTLINEEIVHILRDYNVQVSISIDGPMELHDLCRIDTKGKGTFKKVDKAIELLLFNDITVSASVTMTPYNIRWIKEAPAFLKSKGINIFSLNELIGRTLFLLEGDSDLERYSKQAAEEIISCFIEARQLGIYEDRMMRKINAFTENDFHPVDCGAYGEQIVIQPDGNISNCHASNDYNIVHLENVDVENFRIWRTDRVKRWRQRLPIYNPDCLDCEAISICGGGCAYNAHQIKGDIFARDEAFCFHTKTAFDFAIWDLYKQVITPQ